MFQIITFFLSLCLTFLSGEGNSLFLRQIQRGRTGDFAIFSQGKSYSLVRIHAISQNALIFEELSIPHSQWKRVKADFAQSWQDWYRAGAPFVTSWEMKEYTLPSGQLQEGFSFSQKSWIQLQSERDVLKMLLSQSFSPLSLSEYSRIGSSSSSTREETYSIWVPPAFAKKYPEKLSFIRGWKTSWSEKQKLVLYFCENTDSNLATALPLFISWKRKSTQKNFVWIDGGRDLPSYHSFLPRPSPRILHLHHCFEEEREGIEWTIEVPSYYREFALSFQEKGFPLSPPQMIPCQEVRELISKQKKQTKIVQLFLPFDTLENYLEEGLSYFYRIEVLDFPTLSAESLAPFIYSSKRSG